jgi:hypothetical protein
MTTFPPSPHVFWTYMRYISLSLFPGSFSPSVFNDSTLWVLFYFCLLGKIIILFVFFFFVRYIMVF